jgi:hypothetical protein
VNRASLLRCYFAARRFLPDEPRNRWIGDTMAMILTGGKLLLIAPSGAYSAPFAPDPTHEVLLRFRIPGEKTHYLSWRHHPNPRQNLWHAVDVPHIDHRDADYAEFAAIPEPDDAALDPLRDVLRRALDAAHATLARPPDDLERRDPQLAGIAALARREAQALVDFFRAEGFPHGPAPS